MNGRNRNRNRIASLCGLTCAYRLRLVVGDDPRKDRILRDVVERTTGHRIKIPAEQCKRVRTSAPQSPHFGTAAKRRKVMQLMVHRLCSSKRQGTAGYSHQVVKVRDVTALPLLPHHMPVATLDGRTLSICYKQMEDPLPFFSAASHSLTINTVDKHARIRYRAVRPTACTAKPVWSQRSGSQASTSGSAQC